MHFFRTLLGLLAALFVLFSESKSVFYADIADGGVLHAPFGDLPFEAEDGDVLADGGDCSPLRSRVTVARRRCRPHNPWLTGGRLHSAYVAEEARRGHDALLASLAVPNRRHYRIPTASRLL